MGSVRLNSIQIEAAMHHLTYGTLRRVVAALMHIRVGSHRRKIAGVI